MDDQKVLIFNEETGEGHIIDERAARVAKGATVLNERQPLWFTNVEDRFTDILSCQSCVLGRVYGDYHDGMQALFYDRKEYPKSYSYGFNLTPEELIGSDEKLIQEYERLWQAKAVRARIAYDKRIHDEG